MRRAAPSLGVLIARPMVDVLAHYAARFSVRALDLTLDSSLLWVGVVPRGRGGAAARVRAAAAVVRRVARLRALSNGGVRITGSTTRRLQRVRGDSDRRVVRPAGRSGDAAQDAARAAGDEPRLQHECAGRERADPGVRTHAGSGSRSVSRDRPKISELPGVEHVAVGGGVPWRDAGNFGPGFVFSVEGRTRQPGEEDPRGKFRSVSPGYFAALDIPILAGRDFVETDRTGVRTRRHRRPDAGGADVPRTGSDQPPPDVDRQRHEIHRHQHRTAPHRRRLSRT